jgi:D-arabinose 1-dehydrogenase-like Zn-dependent alcohol dehydrogenase
LSIIGTTIEKIGFKTIAIGRGKDKEDLVRKLGARQYIDSKYQSCLRACQARRSQDGLIKGF